MINIMREILTISLCYTVLTNVAKRVVNQICAKLSDGSVEAFSHQFNFRPLICRAVNVQRLTFGQY